MLWTLRVLWALVFIVGIGGASYAVRHSHRQLVCAVAVFLFAWALRGGISSEHFYGLEYEDAYVYAAAARQAAWGEVGSGFGGLTVCAVGSLENCSVSEVFPGHLPGFPALLRSVQALVAYRVWLAPQIGALVSALAALAVWWSAWAIYGDFLAAGLAALLFAATPALALYGGSATSESASSLPIAVALGATAMARKSASVPAWASWHGAALCAAVLAATVRRENAILIGILAPCLLIVQKSHRTSLRWFIAIVWLAVAALAAWLVLPSAALEVGEYGQFSFGLNRAIETVPTVIRALAAPQWFGLVAGMAGVGVVSTALNWRTPRVEWDTGLLLGLAAALVGMVLLYGSHVRSTYQLMGVTVEPFDFLRYLTNIGVFLCLLAPAPAGVLTWRIRTSTGARRIALAMVASYVTVSAWGAWTLRREMARTEQQVRTEPALAAVEAAAALGNRLPIVTLEPLVVQLFGSPSTKVVGLEFLTRERVQVLGGRVLYVRQDHYENEVNRKRYAEFFSALPVDDVVELRKGSGWAVLGMGAAQTVREPR